MPRCSDRQRLERVIEVMDQLGFSVDKLYRKSSQVPFDFTPGIMFQDRNSSDWVDVSFPNLDEGDKGTDITTQTRFNNKIDSPAWKSLEEFAENIGRWIDECRV